jgi:protein-tyrosine phosphatase
MTTAPQAGTLAVALDGCHNFRAVAGWRTGEGRSLSAGRLFRSDGLDQLSESDQARLAALGLDHVFDLRSSAEIARAPSRWPEWLSLRIWAGAESAAEADITTLMQREGLDAGAFHQAMCRVYAGFPDDLAEAVRALSVAVLHKSAGATLVHCTAGKDRTGFAVAMLLLAIGVTRDDVMADYLLSNASFETARLRFDTGGRLTSLEARAPGAVAAVVGVHADYLHAAMRRMEQDFGSIDTWLERRSGLSGQRRALLAERLLD